MNKVLSIVKRELMARLKKRSFIIMMVIGPLLFSSLMIVPQWVSLQSDKEVKKIAVIDSSRHFLHRLPETEYIKFIYLQNTEVEEVREDWDNHNFYALLYIGHIVHNTPSAIQLMSYRQPESSVAMHITNAIEKEIERQKLRTYEIENIQNILQTVKTEVGIRIIKWSDLSADMITHSGISSILAYVSGFLIYMFILLFGAMILKSVVEEKSGKIVEIIVSSVSPVKLMAGKIGGVALAGIIQFAGWVLFTFIFTISIQNALIPDSKDITDKSQNNPTELFPGNNSTSSTFNDKQIPVSDKTVRITNLVSSLSAIRPGVMIVSFALFFVLGYLLYAALYAAVGAMADPDTDTQQFSLPVTVPLALAVVFLFPVIENPDGNLAVWLSFIPFTSPIIMMARIPFGVPWSQILFSLSVLVITIFIFISLSAKIYRTAILMYGKKVTWKEVIKWLRL